MTAVIPILLYHSVADDPTPPTAPFTVRPSAFARHMDAVKARGFRLLTVSQFVDQMPNVEGRVALITFDDGYLDFATNAVPVMVERDIPSTIYITSGFLEGREDRAPRPADPMMHWSQLPELKSAKVEIGAHGHSHFQMDTLDSKTLAFELTRPKELLEDTLGEPVRSFAYPHGYNGPRVRRATARAGYESAAGVRNVLSHSSDDILNIARLTVMSDTTQDQIEAWLDGQGAVATDGEALQTKGWRMYRRAKAIVTRSPGSVYA